MTPEMRRTLTHIQAYHGQHGVAPTIRELTALEGLSSTGGVHRRVQALIERGYLVKLPGRDRSFAPASVMPDLSAVTDDQLRAELAKREAGDHD
ncbi:MAG: hypothetical protein WBL20_14415 [Sphingobium sp.]|uniref:LexA family protein n=1 Tax=Sphingobium sp. TaxID=1912891 RepID=UPI002E1B4F08